MLAPTKHKDSQRPEFFGLPEKAIAAGPFGTGGESF
jgi:hypothetical protein